MDKATLRHQIKKKRPLLSPAYYDKANKIISNRILNLDIFQSAQTILAFSAMTYEFDSSILQQKAYQQGKKWLLPRVQGKSLSLHAVTPGQTLELSSFGIQEPPLSVPTTSLQDVDLIILPCLSCNHFGERLGYGGGYYDHLLMHYTGATLLPYFEKLMVEVIPTDRYDRKADLVVTEKGLFQGLTSKVSL